MARRTAAASESTSTGPLAGVKVLDLSIALTGPYAVALLADQGAEVVKVERPGIGDIARWVGVSVNGMSAFYLACNRGKRYIAVDLATDEGRQIVMALAATVDVIVQNFRPGVIDRLGLGYEAVRALNPEVVSCSISGYGPEGPYGHRSAYDASIQAYAGFAANQGDPDNGPPTFLHQTAADKVSALYASQAITAALPAGYGPWRATSRDGYGRRLRVVPLGGVRRQRGAARLRRIAGLELRRGASNPCASSTGGASPYPPPTPTSPAYAGPSASKASTTPASPPLGSGPDRDVLEPILDMCYAVAANLTQAEATEYFERERVAFAMVLSTAEIVDDPHAQAIGMFTEFDHPVVGRARLPRHPTRFHGTPAALGGHAPALGRHTDEVLAQLGLGDRVEELHAAGVLA